MLNVVFRNKVCWVMMAGCDIWAPEAPIYGENWCLCIYMKFTKYITDTEEVIPWRYNLGTWFLREEV